MRPSNKGEAYPGQWASPQWTATVPTGGLLEKWKDHEPEGEFSFWEWADKNGENVILRCHCSSSPNTVDPRQEARPSLFTALHLSPISRAVSTAPFHPSSAPSHECLSPPFLHPLSPPQFPLWHRSLAWSQGICGLGRQARSLNSPFLQEHEMANPFHVWEVEE